MYYRQGQYILIALMLSVLFLPGCRSGGNAENKAAMTSDDGKDAQALVSETVAHFNVQTLSSTAKISKVYKNNLTFNDELRFRMKVNGRDMLITIQVKPQADRKGMGMLAEYSNEQIVKLYRYIPDTDRVVEISPNQSMSNVVLGGLSIEEFQIFQGISPFEKIELVGKEEINGQMCYKLDAVPTNKSSYTRAHFFTSVAERLPVLMRVFNKDGELVKEIAINKLEPLGKTWVVKQLAVTDHVFNYVSTFDFEDHRVDEPIPDSVFTPENLKKGW